METTRSPAQRIYHFLKRYVLATILLDLSLLIISVLLAYVILWLWNHYLSDFVKQITSL